MALPLFKKAARKFSWEHPLGRDFFLARKLSSRSSDHKGELPSMDSTHPMQHTMGKSTQALSDNAQIWVTQHLKGCKIYSLPIFLFLFCLIERVKPFLVRPYWALERTLNCLSRLLMVLPSLPSNKTIWMKKELQVILFSSKWELPKRQSNVWSKWMKRIFVFLIFSLKACAVEKVHTEQLILEWVGEFFHVTLLKCSIKCI